MDAPISTRPQAPREVWLVLDPDEIPIRAVSSEEEAVEVCTIESDSFLTHTVQGPFVYSPTEADAESINILHRLLSAWRTYRSNMPGDARLDAFQAAHDALDLLADTKPATKENTDNG